MRAHAGLGWVFRTWWTRHGRELLLAGLLGLPMAALAHAFDGYPALLCWCVAWALLGIIPAARMLELAPLTAQARGRRPAGMRPRRWRALCLGIAACAGAVGVSWLLATPSLILLDLRFDARAIPVVLAIGAGLGIAIAIDLMTSVPRRR